MKLIEISSLSEDILLHEEVIDLYEMANLSSRTTGIPGVVVWVNSGGDRLQHGPRIKVVRGNKFRVELSSTIPLTGVPRIIGKADLSQDEFANVVKWMTLNRETLLQYHDDEIDTAEMIGQLKKI